MLRVGLVIFGCCCVFYLIRLLLRSRRALIFVGIGIIVLLAGYGIYLRCSSLSPRPSPTALGMPPQSIAVVGGGLSGLTLTYRIQRHHRVTLWERSRRLGGNNYSPSPAKVPMRFGVYLMHHSPHLTRLLAQLGLTGTPPNLGPFPRPLVNGTRCRRTVSSSLAFLAELYLPSLWDRWCPSLVRGRMTGDRFVTTNDYYHNFVRPIGGINMFADAVDVDRLPASQTSRYIRDTTFDEFLCVRGGNHLIIDRLVSKVAPECRVLTNSAITHITPWDSSGKVRVNGHPFDQAVVCCQPHVAQRLLPSGLEPHQSIIACFTTVDCYSCLHEYATVFAGLPLASNLSYEVRGSHHYLHIDACYYKLPGVTRPRTKIVSYWYDTAPDIIPACYVLQRSHTVLSRLIAEKEPLLLKLWGKLQTDHRGVMLCNAAYHGFMWHEDACYMADTVASQLLGAHV